LRPVDASKCVCGQGLPQIPSLDLVEGNGNGIEGGEGKEGEEERREGRGTEFMGSAPLALRGIDAPGLLSL